MIATAARAEFRPTLAFYLAVGLVAGAIIALQIAIMRVFSVGSWVHFGSLVVSLAMFGFGLMSAIMCVGKATFEKHWRSWIALALLTFGPLAAICNLLAQQIPFNAIFIVSNPAEKWRLLANFLLYFLPFLSGALFLGVVFLRSQTIFARVYFADLAGSGLCGLAFLLAMYVFPPHDLIAVPLILWAAGGLCWFAGERDMRGMLLLAVAAVVAFGVHYGAPPLLGAPKIAVSDYKGVSYARKFPDAARIYERWSPFGYMEMYGSSYLHFAPGLSDNAAFNLPEMPKNAYFGLYVDSEGPTGVAKPIPERQTGYFRFLPMYYPYLLKKQPETFVVQFSGGISTVAALRAGSTRVTVAEGNPMLLDAFRNDRKLRGQIDDVLNDPKVEVVPYEGRLYARRTPRRYDVVDLSLADSAGLSSPGGFAIVEKYAYTQEAMADYMRALKDGGVLSVTLWNKEEPPKSTLKLYATMVEAARTLDGKDVSNRFYSVSGYLNTTTVLYKRGGFSAEEIAALSAHTRAMSFDEIYKPGPPIKVSDPEAIVRDYWNSIFGAPADPTAPEPEPKDEEAKTDADGGPRVPATEIARIAWAKLMDGGWPQFMRDYVFDVKPLTNHKPYFAAYVKVQDLPKVTDRLEVLQDEWGYLLLWAQLGIGLVAGLLLVAFPVVFGWRQIFSRYPGKFGTWIYFLCLGLGYIVMEVGAIGHFMLALSNATVSASVLITGMLVFSGLGSFVCERYLDRARAVLPKVLLAIGAILIVYAFLLDPVLDAIGSLPYALRIAACLALLFPPAFLMGFPFATGMSSLARLGKDHMFLWAWGINGSFSVIGAALVPLVATSFGQPAVLLVAAGAYLVAIPAFFALLRPLRPAAA